MWHELSGAGDREIHEYLRDGQISRVFSGQVAVGLEPAEAMVFTTKV